MNQTKILPNETAFIKEIYFYITGSSWLRDSLYLFLISPIGLIGTILNSISLSILLKKQFHNSALFKYLQVYTANGIVLSATLSCAFLISPRYFFELNTSYSARIYKCLIVPSHVVALSFFFSNAMDVLINIERAAAYYPKFKRFKNIPPYIACFILLLICVVFNSPNYLLITPSSDYDVNKALSSIQNIMKFKGLCLRNPIYLTSFGTIITVFGFVVKDLLTLSLNTITSWASLYYMRSFYRKKAEITNENPRNKKSADREAAKLRQTYMTLSLAIFSILLHLFEFAAVLVIFFFYENMEYSFSLTVFIYVLIGFKQLINFPIFCFFNTKFRKCFLNTNVTKSHE